MNAIVKIAVSESGLIKNLKSVFSTDKTFVREIMQNARRSGATELHMTVTKNAVVFRDNGCGIDDFQKLLTLADSGWDGDDVVNEKPFGMGFFSALFAGEEVTVLSKGKMLKIDTASAASFEDLHVVVDPRGNVDGTHITILKKDGFAGVYEEAVAESAAFPIPVLINGEEVSRPLWVALQKGYYIVDRADIGRIAFREEYFGQTYDSTGVVTVLNGSPVGGRSRFGRPFVVVDLDPQIFGARMPDRDILLNAEESMTRIRAAVKEEALKKFEVLLSQLGDEEFVKRHGSAVHRLDLKAIWNKIDLIRGVFAEKIVDCPIVKNDFVDDFTAVVEGNISRAAIESGEVVVCKNLCCYHDDGSWALSMLAKVNGWIVIEERSFDADHWVHKHLIDLADLDLANEVEETLVIDVVDIPLSLDCHHDMARVVPCNGYSFTHNGISHTVNDMPLVYHEEGLHGFTIIVPLNSHAADVAALLMSVNDEDSREYWESCVNEVEIALSDARGSDFGMKLTKTIGHDSYKLGNGNRMAICLERSHNFAFDCTALIKELFVSNPEVFAKHFDEAKLATLSDHINRA
jgi:hypothetical protein